MYRLGSADKTLIAELKKSLANTTVFYHQSHGYHWNLVDKDFQEYHALFETIYSDVYDAIDPMAENVRKLGGISPFLLDDFLRLSSLVERQVSTYDAKTLTQNLYDDNKIVISDLKKLFVVCDEQNEQGLANFIAERIDMHQKWQWQLGSSLGMSDVVGE